MARNHLRIAFTGAGGYLGASLCRYFNEQGASVFALTGKPQATARSSTHFSLVDGVAKGFFADNEIDTLVHAAYDFRPLKRKDIWDTNVKGSVSLFKQAQSEGLRRVVFISTMSAYEGCRSLYGQAKLEIENALHGMDFGYAVRPGLIYSTPLEDSGGMIGSMVNKVRRGGVLPLIGGGEQKLYLTHEQDLARFIEGLVRRAGELQTSVVGKNYFTTANPTPYAFRRIVELLTETTKAKRVRFVPVPWPAVWLGLKGLEIVGVNAGFRSDSVLSLAYQQERPDFSTLSDVKLRDGDLVFRDFAQAISARA